MNRVRRPRMFGLHVLSYGPLLVIAMFNISTAASAISLRLLQIRGVRMDTFFFIVDLEDRQHFRLFILNCGGTHSITILS